MAMMYCFIVSWWICLVVFVVVSMSSVPPAQALKPSLEIISRSKQQQQQPIQQQQHQRRRRRRPWKKEDYPNPRTDPIACRSSSSTSTATTTGVAYICDPDELISTTELHQLQWKLQLFTNHTYYYSNNQPQQQQPQYIQIHIHLALVRKMEWNSVPYMGASQSNNNSNNNNYNSNNYNSNGNSHVTSFQAAEEFARYLYQQWVVTPPTNKDTRASTSNHLQTTSTPKLHHTSNTSSSSSQLLHTTTTIVKKPLQYHMLLLIAKEDQMVYIARSSNHPSNRNVNQSYLNSQIEDSILNPIRLERILVHPHMMKHLQQQHYVGAANELLLGIDFLMNYGPPKFWERWFISYYYNYGTTTPHQSQSHHHQQEQLYWTFIMLLVTMAFICLNWYPLLHLYDQYLYYYQDNHNYNINGNHHRWIHRYITHPLVAATGRWQTDDIMHVELPPLPLTPHEYVVAEELRQRYHAQDSCPICLEPFISSSFPPTTISSSKSTTVDQQRHIVDDTLNHQQQQQQQYGSDQKPVTLLRCGHVYDTTCWNKWRQYHLRRHPQRRRRPEEQHLARTTTTGIVVDDGRTINGFGTNSQQHQQQPLKCLICQQ